MIEVGGKKDGIGRSEGWNQKWKLNYGVVRIVFIAKQNLSIDDDVAADFGQNSKKITSIWLFFLHDNLIFLAKR